MKIKTVPRVILALPSLSDHGLIQIKIEPKYPLILGGGRIFPVPQEPGHGSAGQGFPRQSPHHHSTTWNKGKAAFHGGAMLEGLHPRRCTWRFLGCILGLLLLLLLL